MVIPEEPEELVTSRPPKRILILICLILAVGALGTLALGMMGAVTAASEMSDDQR